MKKSRFVSLVAFAGLVLSVFVTPASANRGIAPDFEVVDLHGREIQLSKLRGCGVVLQFSASWCPYCHKQLPALVEAHRQTRSRGVLFMVINVKDDSDDDARAYAQEHGVIFPVIRDYSEAIAKAYRVQGLPQVAMIAPNGTLRKVLVGYSSAHNFVREAGAVAGGRRCKVSAEQIP